MKFLGVLTSASFSYGTVRSQFSINIYLSSIEEHIFVGNKTTGQILKHMFQENKVCQIFQKTNISYPAESNVCVHIRG